MVFVIRHITPLDRISISSTLANNSLIIEADRFFAKPGTQVVAISKESEKQPTATTTAEKAYQIGAEAAKKRLKK